MDTDTKGRLDRVREAARTLLAERDWFRNQADVIDAALTALGVDGTFANHRPSQLTRPIAKPLKEPGKRTVYASATEYRTNTELIEEALRAGPMDIRRIATAVRKMGREMTYPGVASLCSKGTAAGRFRRVGVGVYRLPSEEHELTSHFGEMPTDVVGLPREASGLTAAVPAHLLAGEPGEIRASVLTLDPDTGKREYATDYHEEPEDDDGE